MEKLPFIVACFLLALWSALLQLYSAPARVWVAEQWQKWRFEEPKQGEAAAIIPQCLAPAYTTRIVMLDPFVMHIENFITAEERAYLLDFG